MAEQPVCFVISPIGASDSPGRKRADQTIRHLIRPAVEPHGYQVIRADQEERPGFITSQIINRLVDSPLVVADLTDHNPNVFYELAVRHVTEKPLVQVIKRGQVIPFDVAPMRTIQFDLSDPDDLQAASKRLGLQVETLKPDESPMETPVSVAKGLKQALESGDAETVERAEIMEVLQTLATQIQILRSQSARASGTGSFVVGSSLRFNEEGNVIDADGNVVGVTAGLNTVLSPDEQFRHVMGGPATTEEPEREPKPSAPRGREEERKDEE
jgi:hypothetical protein